MFAFLAILRRDSFSPETDAEVADAASRAFPWAKQLETDRWKAPSSRAAVWVWTNEKPRVTGQTEWKPESATIKLGVGEGATCHIAHDRLTCSTTLVRQDPIYYATLHREVIVANRALLIAFLLAKGARPEFDLQALSAGFANAYNAGGFITNRTPFAGVDLAPPNARLSATARGVTLTDPDNLHRDFGFGTEEPTGRFYEEVGDALVASLRASASGIPNLQFGITGGKDSRLLGAALKAAGISFGTYTSGFAGDPDVVIGKRVADFLGAPNQHIVPPHFESEYGNLLGTDARGEVARALMLSDGMNFYVPSLPRTVSTKSAYESIHFYSNLDVTTDGAEIWRSGYASRDFSWFRPETVMSEVTADRIKTLVEDICSRNAGFLKPELRRLHEKTVADWLSPFLRRGRAAAAAERFYLDFEIGRRLSAMVTQARATRAYFQPFMQDELLRKIDRLRPRYRRDHFVHYNLIKRFAPGLELLPLESMRWGFEWDAPVNEADRAAWLARAPVPYTPQTSGGWPMYGAAGSDCWRRLYDEVFCFGNGENVWSFLERDALLKAFRSNDIFSSQLSSLFWVIHGLSILMSGDWLAPEQVPEGLIFARYEKPWPAIYGDLCAEARTSETSALDVLSSGIAERLKGAENSAAEAHVAKTLLALGEGALASARISSGRDHRLQAATQNEGRRTFWRVAVEADPGTPPANSFAIFSLAPPGKVRAQIDIALRLRYQGDKLAEGHCYLARYGASGRSDLKGPVLKYGPEWQSVEHSFPMEPGEDIKRLEFLLGLPDRACVAEIEDLSIEFLPRAMAPSPSALAERADQEAVDSLRSILERLTARYGLSESDIHDLRGRAGLDDSALTPSKAYDFARFETWVTEICKRPTKQAIAERLSDNLDYWPFLRRCLGFSELMRARLIEGAVGELRAPK